MQASPAQSKIYWLGKHSWQRVGAGSFQSPLGKLHSEGLKLLEGHGWHRVAADTADVPVFAFTTRKGANFPASGPGLPRIRQLPQQCTSTLDDKRRMWECLSAAGRADITPQTWVDVDAFLHQFGTDSSGSSGSSSGGAAAVDGLTPHQPAAGNAAAAPAAGCLPQQAQEPQQEPQMPHQHCWFLKHRHGVKGQAVYCFTDLQALLSRLSALSARSRRDFVVQQGVPPLLLPSAGGRAFVLRAHILLLLLPAQPSVDGAFEASVPHHARAFVHRDVIVLEHARRYDPGCAERAVHISSCGSGHPQPYLLPQLGLEGSGSDASSDSLEGRRGVDGRLDEQEVAAGACSPPPLQAPLEQPGAGGFTPTQPPLPEQQQQQQLRGGQRVGQPQPPPQQPQQLATELQRRLWAQLCSAACASLRAGAAGGLLPADPDPAATFYQLFGYDFAVDPGGRAWLLEVNAYPAIASGTMRLVDGGVYTGLVGDLLGLVVLPATDGTPPAPGGFVEVPLGAA